MIPVLPALTKASADRFGGAPAWVLARSRRTLATRAGAGCAGGPPRFALLPRAAAPFFSCGVLVGRTGSLAGENYGRARPDGGAGASCGGEAAPST